MFEEQHCDVISGDVVPVCQESITGDPKIPKVFLNWQKVSVILLISYSAGGGTD